MMKAAFASICVTEWQCNEEAVKNLAGFKVMVKHTFSPFFYSGDDTNIYLLELHWLFQLYSHDQRTLLLFYKLHTDYYLSLEDIVEPEFPGLWVQHSLQGALQAFDAKKINTPFLHYQLRLFTPIEELADLLKNSLMAIYQNVHPEKGCHK